jgi:hypothetical protein
MEKGFGKSAAIQSQAAVGAGWFGTLTLALHSELLRGDRAALGLACFIGAYWAARVIVDAFYFSHSDWPVGRQYAIGHILLTSLFSLLAITYLGLFIWHLWLNK